MGRQFHSIGSAPDKTLVLGNVVPTSPLSLLSSSILSDLQTWPTGNEEGRQGDDFLALYHDLV